MAKLFEGRLSPAQILVTGFAAVILVGAFLLTLPLATVPGKETSFLTALFTATSAVCVTGLVVVDTGTHYTLFGQLVILSLIQIGGLGFMTMASLLMLLMGKRINLRERLVMQEALNHLTMEGIVRLTKYILFFTFTVEGLASLILSARLIPDLGLSKGVYYGIFHSISAFNNAGFDLFGGFQSLTNYTSDIIVTLVITTLIIIGGLGFSVIAGIYREKGFKKVSLHSKLVLTITAILLIVGTVVIFALERTNPATLQPLSPMGKILASYFQSVTPRTAGYNTLDIASLRSATQFFIIILMFIGASPGSTGGGIKTTTFGTLIIAIRAIITGKDDVVAFRRRIPWEIILRALAITIMALLLVAVVTMALTISEKADFLTLLFETTSAFGTVGLSMGLTPKLSYIGRILIIATMFAGRLGPLTVAYALSMQKRKSLLKYPEEKIIVG